MAHASMHFACCIAALFSSPFCAAVERQNSLDGLDYYSHEEPEGEERTTPPTSKKGKKKRHFSMFRRSAKRKSKSKSKDNEQFSLSAGLMQTLPLPTGALQGVRQSFSNASLSYESEASMESDQELVDTLMNPTPPPPLPSTEGLQPTENQVTDSEITSTQTD